MDWTMVASVLVALLLWPVVMVSAGALIVLTAATVFRGRWREIRNRHMGRCRQMCDRAGLAATTAGPTATKSCQERRSSRKEVGRRCTTETWVQDTGS